MPNGTPNKFVDPEKPVPGKPGKRKQERKEAGKSHPETKPPKKPREITPLEACEMFDAYLQSSESRASAVETALLYRNAVDAIRSVVRRARMCPEETSK